MGGGEGFFRTVFLVVGCGEEVEECHVVGRLGCFGGDGDAEVYGTFSYYVRSDGAGTYKAESAYLSHSELSGVYAKSSEQTITLH